MLKRSLLVPLFLAAQAALVHWAADSERPPQPPDLSSFPAKLGEWEQLGEDPLGAAVTAELGADRLLSRTYLHRPSGLPASLFVAWYQSQRQGHSLAHSPKVCLPGSGWMPELTGEVALDTPSGAITVNRYRIVKARERATVLFWYQGPRRVVAGEWEAKLWLVIRAIQDHRTDASLVRVVVWEKAGEDSKAALAGAIGFVRGLYPLLREQLPR